jgi:hypothetical protein
MKDNAMLEADMIQLRGDIHALSLKVEVLSESIHDLVAAWETANGIARLVKWSASIVTALGVLWAALHWNVK